MAPIKPSRSGLPKQRHYSKNEKKEWEKLGALAYAESDPRIISQAVKKALSTMHIINYADFFAAYRSGFEEARLYLSK